MSTMIYWFYNNIFTIKNYILLFIIVIVFIFLTKMIDFNKYDYSPKNKKVDAIISIITIIIISMVAIIYMIIRKYFSEVSVDTKYNLQFLIEFIDLFLVISVVKLRKEDMKSIGITKNSIFKSIITGLLLGFIYCVLEINMFSTNKLYDILSIQSIKLFIMLFIVAFVEEVVFRGYLQSRLITWIGTVKGSILGTLIFSFGHLPQRLIVGNFTFKTALMSSLALIPMSLLFGYMTNKTKNILTGSLFHGISDWIGSILTILH